MIAVVVAMEKEAAAVQRALPEDAVVFLSGVGKVNAAVGGLAAGATGPIPPEPASAGLAQLPNNGGGGASAPNADPQQEAGKAPAKGGGNPSPQRQARQAHIPRTPSEAARMRREKEMREKADNGGGGGAQAEAARTRPSFARPMPGAAGRGMRGSGVF